MAGAKDVNLDMEAELAKLFGEAIVKAYPIVADNPPKTLIVPGKTDDYQCNNAMPLRNQLSKMDKGFKQSPKEVAEAIAAAADTSTGLIEKAWANDKGFINITVGVKYIANAMATLVKKGPQPPVVKKEKVLVDFSSPNIAKTMHVGHLRSTIIGDVLSRVFEFCGHEVHRVNHVGDWGTQFGMLIAHLKDQCPNFLEQPPDISNLVVFYKAAKARFDAEPDFKERSLAEVVKLQSGDETNLKAWKIICDISRLEFEKTYKLLDVTLTEVGESFYNPIIPDVLKIMDAKGMVKENEGAKVVVSQEWKPLAKLGKGDMERTVIQALINPKGREEKVHPVLVELGKEIGAVKEEDGKTLLAKDKGFVEIDSLEVKDVDAFVKKFAKLFKPLHAELEKVLKEKGVLNDKGELGVPRFDFPLIVTKSDGGYTYDTTDCAAVWYRTQKIGMDRVVYVTDLGQEPHFKMIFQAARDAGWDVKPDGGKIRLDHVGFGVVCGNDGKKFRSRHGDTAQLKDLLDEGIEHSFQESLRRQEEKIAEAKEKGETYVPFPEEELRKSSEVIGIGAIKYFDLRGNRASDYVFDLNKMTSLEGNTAVQIVYAYVRTCSLVRKAGVDIDELKQKDVEVVLELECERKLGMHLLRFPAVIEATLDTLKPNMITDFAFQTVNLFGTCYNNSEWQVVGHKYQDSRLLLAVAVGDLLRKCLNLLGIETITRI